MEIFLTTAKVLASVFVILVGLSLLFYGVCALLGGASFIKNKIGALSDRIYSKHNERNPFPIEGVSSKTSWGSIQKTIPAYIKKSASSEG